MREDVANKKPAQLSQGVETMQQLIAEVAARMSGIVGGELSEYLAKTEIPILQEFCSQYGYTEEKINEKRSEPIIKELLERLETKKRGALERMIYSGELNATIGAHLLKAWRELPPPPKTYPGSIDWNKLTDDEAKEYIRITHKAHGLTTVRQEREVSEWGEQDGPAAER